MTIYTFISKFKEKHPNDHYFDSDTLKFWGERISEMRILKDPVKTSDIYGEEHVVYVLSKKMKDWNGKRIRVHDYFDVDTLERIIR